MLIFLNKKNLHQYPPPGGDTDADFFFIKKKSTSYHDADDPGNGEGMGGDWKRDTFQTPPNIPPQGSIPRRTKKDNFLASLRRMIAIILLSEARIFC